MSQSSGPFYFGLADAQAVDEVRVRWPSEKEQTIEGSIKINQLLEAKEP